MNEQKGKGWLIAAMLWCLIALVLGAAYKFLVHPHLAGKLKEATGSSSQYKEEIRLGADSFSGYCILRSDLLKQDLKAQQIKLTVQDDKADSDARLRALREGKTQFAVFTVDSLMAAGAKAGDFPATIVWVIDETKGGDAIVAYPSGVASVQDLNHSSARIVLTPNSPSEFLARVVLANFHLPNLPEQWKVEADGASAVFKAFRAANSSEKKAYALWEPYVSKALEQSGARVLIDSSKLKGMIVDVLVVQRQFLRDRPEVVKAFVESYARSAYSYARQPEGMLKLVKDDAQRTGAESLTEPQARKVVEGIQWKNTLENYAHFSLASGADQGGLQSLEDIIGRIAEVLVKTKALTSDPLGGSYSTLYYDKILAELKQAHFHPGMGKALVPGLGLAEPNSETVRRDTELAPLSTEQWNDLRPIGELSIAPIEFGRGSANITLDGERELQALARRLQSFPRFYVRVFGNARTEGDPEANRVLARSRADAAAQSLIAQGLSANRVKADIASQSAGAAGAQVVSIVVGQTPY